jgi:hypothetical protein
VLQAVICFSTLLRRLKIHKYDNKKLFKHVLVSSEPRDRAAPYLATPFLFLFSSYNDMNQPAGLIPAPTTLAYTYPLSLLPFVERNGLELVAGTEGVEWPYTVRAVKFSVPNERQSR